MQEPPPRAGDVAPYVEDDRAATLGDIRGLRRWLVVTAVWAAAATALAVIALIQANKDDDATRTRAAGELGRVQRSLNDRIDELESRIDELPTSDDVAKLDNRIKDIERSADTAATNTEKLGNRVEDLEGRVDALEESSQTQTTTTNTTTTP
jgi:TolA-binding protein